MSSIADIYPLSPAQEGILFHSLLAPGDGMYVEQMSCVLRGRLDVEAFRRAWSHLADRHPVLRTAFVWEGRDRPLQFVVKRMELPWHLEDLGREEAGAREVRIARSMEIDRLAAIDLTRPPLMRFRLMRLGEDLHQFLWTFHHILLDGWSTSLLLAELSDAYASLRRNEDPSLPPVRPYRDYVSWLRRQDRSREESFWRERLRGFPAPTPLPAGRIDDEPREERQGEQCFHLSEEETSAVRERLRAQRWTFNTLVQGAWAILLGGHSRENDVVFGSTLSGRPADLSGVEAMVGLFINTVPVRARIDPGIDVQRWLARLQSDNVELGPFEHTPLTSIQGWSDVPRDLPLFESLVVIENFPERSGPAGLERSAGLSVESTRAIDRTNYPIALGASLAERIEIVLSYDARRFDADAASRIGLQLRTILAGIASARPGRLRDVPSMSEQERQAILIGWNDGASPDGPEECLHSLFEEQAGRSPEAPAIEADGRTITYAELNGRSNRLARRLRKIGVGPEILVGIFADRSVEAIVGCLAVLKAGGAYVPLDPSYPAGRLAFMIADAGIRTILAAGSPAGRMPDHGATIVALDEIVATEGTVEDVDDSGGASADNLAYVMYTSGSTGRPKGTLIQHRDLSRTIRTSVRRFGLDAGCRVLQLASISFDASVLEIFTALASGGCLHLVDRETILSGAALAEKIRGGRITTIITPPSLLDTIPEGDFPSLRTVVVGGESCAASTAARWSDRRRFLNAYAPTEATIYATLHEASGEIRRPPPVGRPIEGRRCYLLDASMNPVPAGAKGEIYLGGAGVARGYLGRPDLTAERFVPDPFGDRPGGRLYRSGDLGRWLPDGSIEFLGRADDQVKIRGFRIEPGEIEWALREIPAVRDAVVAAREDHAGAKRLVAWVVPADGSARSAQALAASLGDRLPAHMIPSAIVWLEALPMTPSGKIDRRALPDPDAPADQAPTAVAPTMTPIEEMLAGIWCVVLGRPHVGPDDSFFLLGGHSLLATRIVSRVRDALGVEIPLRLVFETPTVRGLAREIERIRREGEGPPAPPIVPVPREGELQLSFAQERLWLLDQLEPDNAFYNVHAVVRLQGSLDVEALRRAFQSLVDRHEALRTRFRSTAGTPVQVIDSAAECAFRVVDRLDRSGSDSRVIEEVLEEAARPFDLAKGPLFRALLLRLGEEEHVLAITMHHLVSDAWSMGVIVREMAILYGACRSGKVVPLPPLSVQYADYARWQRNRLQGAVLDRLLAYWKEKLAGAPPFLDLPIDRARPAVQTFRGASRALTIPSEVTLALREIARRSGSTLFVTLLAAFKTFLLRHTGQEDAVVGSPIANRTHAGVEDVVGFFVNTLVLRTDLSGNPTFEDLLRRVRDTAMEAYDHQDLPFQQIVEALEPPRSLAHSPLFQVMFDLQNDPGPAPELGGLTLTPLEVDTGTSKFDLSLSFSDEGEDLRGAFEYSTDLFDPSTIDRMADRFLNLVSGIASGPSRRILDLPLLGDEERGRLLADGRGPRPDRSSTTPVHRLVEARAQGSPDATAIVCGDRRLSYGELDRLSNRLARRLQGEGAGRDVLVGIHMERSLEQMVAILGVLKSGAAYLPLDPAWPEERLALMADEARPRVVLTREPADPRNGSCGTRALVLDPAWEAIRGESDESIQDHSRPDDLAYVIYTSGSSGRPKGVMIAHRGLAPVIRTSVERFDVAAGDRILQTASASFDASVLEIFAALTAGAELHLVDRETMISGDALSELLRRLRVRTLITVPSVLDFLPDGEYPDLATIVLGAERCGAATATRWSRGRRILNVYAPTEASIYATLFEAPGGFAEAPPIGRPIEGCRAYVLSASLDPAPIGVTGEIFLGGAGLSRGYLERPDLTAERFVPDPFGDPPGSRLYRTGDLARWSPGGDLEFLGRNDDQVKIHGFRIEPGEIESALLEDKSIRDAAVVAVEDGAAKHLAAFIVPARESQIRIGAPVARLRGKLPHYMVPSSFVVLHELPLTATGKIDRRALIAKALERGSVAPDRVAPRTPVERALALIWEEALLRDGFGVRDGFFEIGGHSLLVSQVRHRVQEIFQIEMPLRIFFEAPTIEDLSKAVLSRESRPGRSARMAELFLEVETMSEEMVRGALASRAMERSGS